MESAAPTEFRLHDDLPSHLLSKGFYKGLISVSFLTPYAVIYMHNCNFQIVFIL